MISPSDIQYILGNEIDRKKWDDCVHASTQAGVYAYSWYLDAVTLQWDALVLGDYEYILPLPWKKKWNIAYVYQPAFVQFLPLLGKGNVDQELVDAFFLKASNHFRWIHANFNISPSSEITTDVIGRKNFILSIPREETALSYREKKEFKKNLKKSTGCKFSEVKDSSEVVRLYQEAYGQYYPKTSFDPAKIKNLLDVAVQQEKAKLYAIHNENDELIFAAGLLFEKNRIIYVLGAPTESGRKKSVTHFFIDHIIQSHLNQNKIFDFEGSEIQNVADFYKKFDPETELYYEVKINQLSLLAKWLKK